MGVVLIFYLSHDQLCSHKPEFSDDVNALKFQENLFLIPHCVNKGLATEAVLESC